MDRGKGFSLDFHLLNTHSVIHEGVASGSERTSCFLNHVRDERHRSTSAVDGWPVLNPLTPSVFFPLQVAYQVEISKYILIGTLGASFFSQLSR